MRKCTWYGTPFHQKVGKHCEIAVFARGGGGICGFTPHSYGDVPLSVKCFKYQSIPSTKDHEAVRVLKRVPSTVTKSIVFKNFKLESYCIGQLHPWEL